MAARTRTAWILGLVLVGSVLVAPGPAAAEELPDQMIYRGLGPDPLGDPGQGPARMEMRWLELPDGRAAREIDISWWAKVGDHHAAQVGLGYVGIEDVGFFRYGGGRTSLRWTSRFGLSRRVGLALDAAGDVPLGDPTLFPLSARAPMGVFRARLGVFRHGPVRFWVGWWARRVSPPSDKNRQDPLSGFASGSGYDALMVWRLGRFDLDWMLDLPTGGPQHQVFHWSVAGDWWFAEDLALRLGFALDTGPTEWRSYDWEARLGATWRRPAGESEG